MAAVEGFAGPLQWVCAGRALHIKGAQLRKARNGFANSSAVCSAVPLARNIASGVFNCEILVQARQCEYTTSIFFGVCEAAGRARRIGLGTHAMYASACGVWSINCATGGLWGAGVRNEHAVGEPVEAGDRLGWVLDTHAGTLRFMRNGSPFGPGFDTLPLGVPLLPFVELYGQGEAVELCGGVSWTPRPGSTLVFPWRPLQNGCECQAQRWRATRAPIRALSVRPAARASVREEEEGRKGHRHRLMDI